MVCQGALGGVAAPAAGRRRCGCAAARSCCGSCYAGRPATRHATRRHAVPSCQADHKACASIPQSGDATCTAVQPVRAPKADAIVRLSQALINDQSKRSAELLRAGAHRGFWSSRRRCSPAWRERSLPALADGRPPPSGLDDICEPCRATASSRGGLPLAGWKPSDRGGGGEVGRSYSTLVPSAKLGDRATVSTVETSS